MVISDRRGFPLGISIWNQSGTGSAITHMRVTQTSKTVGAYVLLMFCFSNVTKRIVVVVVVVVVVVFLV